MTANLRKKRDFGIINFPYEGDIYGHYKGVYPYQAATKAFTKLSKLVGIGDSNEFLVFVIIDRGNKKTYKYQGTRVKLDRPINLLIDGKNIEIQYRSIISRFNPMLNK